MFKREKISFKKGIQRFSVLLVLLSISSLVKAQAGMTALPFLEISPSPTNTAMAGAFVALETDDPFAAYYNPAQLGFSNNDNVLSVSFNPTRSEYLFPKMGFYNQALSYRTKLKGTNYTYGFSLINVFFDLGKQVATDEQNNVIGEYESYDWATSASASFGYQSKFWNWSFGYSLKRIGSRFYSGDFIGGNYMVSASTAIVWAHDFGVQTKVSLLSFMNPSQKLNSFEPFVDLSLGYAFKNVGDQIKYTNTDQSDPLPRMAVLGYALSLGFKGEFRNQAITFLKVDLATEARDILVKKKGFMNADSTYTNNITYQYGLGDIKFVDHFLKGGNSSITANYRGLKISVLDFVSISLGNFKEPGEVDANTSGYSIQIDKLAKLILNNKMPSYLNKYKLGFSYSEVKFNDNSFYDPKYYGLTLGYQF